VDDLTTAKDYAQTGVDHIYVESLTQHSTALDVGMVIA
jgi:nicotinate-nucleotide pyrophosphorylase